MTSEEEIASLRAELARERSRADGLQEIVHALTVKRRSSGAERQARYRARHSDVTSNASPPPSPPSPFPSSFPPSPAPSSPYPLSFPPSSPPPSASQEPAVPERPTLVLTAQKPGKQPRKPSAAESLFASLQAMRAARCEEVGEPWVEETWPHARRNRDLKHLVEAPGEAQALFEAAWGLYLADDGERVREPAWSLSWFMASGVRARYETRAARGEGT